MRLGAILFLLVLALVIGVFIMMDRRDSAAAARAWETTVPEAPAKKPAKQAVSAAPAKAVKRHTTEPVADLQDPTTLPATPVEVIAPVPRPFPTAADIQVGLPKVVLSAYHAPTIRLSTAEKGQLKETYVYCPGGETDTWVQLRNGKVIERYDADHPAGEPFPN